MAMLKLLAPIDYELNQSSIGWRFRKAGEDSPQTNPWSTTTYPSRDRAKRACIRAIMLEV